MLFAKIEGWSIQAFSWLEQGVHSYLKMELLVMGFIATNPHVRVRRISVSWFLWWKNIAALCFPDPPSIQLNRVAAILLIANEQRVSVQLQVANEHPLVVLLTPRLDSRMEDLDLP